MHMPYLPNSVILLSAISLVSAGDICTYTSRSCFGSFGCCYGIAQNTCCYWPSNYGWSVKFQNMPMTSTWFGKTFGTSTCSTQTGGGGSSSGSICTSVFNGPTYLNWLSANWNAGTGTRRDAEARDDANCVQPNVVGFTTEDGKEHLVKVPEGKFNEVNEWVKAGNFPELLKLDSV